MPPRRATTKGFTRTSNLIAKRVRTASESRGFAQARLLTHWAEIVGLDAAEVSRPVEVTYGRGGMGATLTLLTTGAYAPMLEMQKEQLRAKVNSVYGYNAISRIRVTQTAAVGFAEGQVAFAHKPSPERSNVKNPNVVAKAAETARPVSDEGLRTALTLLGENILNRTTK